MIQDLDPYDHLGRVFRICVVHDLRNIKKCPVPEEVRWLMRSLVCIEHDDWQGTLSKIRENDGKVGNRELLLTHSYTKLIFLGKTG
jgi:hypothetical protein